MNEMLCKGNVIEFDYPAANYCHVKPRLDRRVAVITNVRDLAAQPLDPLTFQLEPNLRRGRILVTTFDLQKQAERTFYADSMQEIEVIRVEPLAQESWSVLWFECHEFWLPSDPELPDEFVIKDWLAKQVPESIAEIIAAGANALAVRQGMTGHWAFACPPGALSQFEPSP